ncbi:MAG TPA: S53 family peptidase [Cyclobacteriaceae bacterium]|jgi:kumamolisin|nr:S53 family peptidase [Cyclobacteriaceae bacterium]
MAERKVFEDSVVPIPVENGPIHNGLMLREAEPEHRDEELTLLFSIDTPKQSQAALEDLVAKGQSLSIDEQHSKYGVDQNDTKTLTSWLKANKFKIEKTSSDGASIYAKAKVDQIEKVLQVKMIRVTKNGITYTAAQDAPSLPMSVGKNVHAIIGLQPFRQAHKNSRKFIPSASGPLLTSKKSKSSRKTAKGSSRTLAVNAKPPYLTQDIARAYNADDVGFTGKGQTIAILIDTFPTDDDLKLFWKKNNLKTKLTQIKKINVKGEALPPPEGEETLDVQWTSGIAPGAKIRIYATGTLQFVDLDRALDRIIEDVSKDKTIRQLSISLGLGETYMGGPTGEVATQHNKFLKLAAAGVNVFVSSGDAGSNPGPSGHDANGPTQAEYGSSDSAVIGVGGTSLKLNTNGSVKAETGWNSSGGGESKFFAKPAWQKGTGITGNKRLVPDVSAVADPNTGGLVILNGLETQYGGTSWSAPVWAGFCALINEARKKAKKPLLPFLNPLIYPLLGTACFRDIVKGDNGVYNAKSGHDLITGIGVPNVKEIIKALA